ncbi:MAG: MBOAT family protein [Candidatus Hydrogenedentes bacterium]|nr:MBOAT family protein [Candidatus Hydrogenedentota bacterium]
MLFNSFQFLAFFPIVAALYFLVPFRRRWLLLLAASYLFYMCWRPGYILLIIASTLIDYVAALEMGKTESRAKRRLYLVLSLCTNLGLLFSFKYFNFFNESVKAFFEFYGLPYEVPMLKVLLPVGISFYTFQTLSYTIDVYRGAREPERHLGYFALYVAFFPQLVAGPIERSTHLLPQFFEKHRFDMDRLRSGLLQMGCGFFKKLIIADRLAVYVNEVYNNPMDYEGLPVLVATYCFAFQIFCDFSGYSDIAIGTARILGFDIMKNFNTPYYAKSIGEFWRRWHISLSTWFRDYLYIPLGGNRVRRRRLYGNLMIVFVLSGLWHGANWTFLFWGALHGCYLIAGIVTGPIRHRLAERFVPARFEPVHRLVQIAITFHLVLLSWVFFRANSITDAFVLLRGMVHGFSLADPNVLAPVEPFSFLTAVAGIVAMECVHLAQRRRPLADRLFALPLPLRWAAYYLFIFAIIAFGTFTTEEFIYFQF